MGTAAYVTRGSIDGFNDTGNGVVKCAPHWDDHVSTSHITGAMCRILFTYFDGCMVVLLDLKNIFLRMAEKNYPAIVNMCR